MPAAPGLLREGYGNGVQPLAPTSPTWRGGALPSSPGGVGPRRVAKPHFGGSRMRR